MWTGVCIALWNGSAVQRNTSAQPTGAVADSAKKTRSKATEKIFNAEFCITLFGTLYLVNVAAYREDLA
jgi:hypothetical protein